ncbi:MAG: hypothetical protein ACLPX8_25585 [Bryobacteraceae bacterium]
MGGELPVCFRADSEGSGRSADGRGWPIPERQVWSNWDRELPSRHLESYSMALVSLYPLSLKRESCFVMAMRSIPQATVIALTQEGREALDPLSGSHEGEARIRNRARIVETD